MNLNLLESKWRIYEKWKEYNLYLLVKIVKEKQSTKFNFRGIKN